MVHQKRLAVIRRRLAAGETLAAVGHAMGVSRSVIHQIITDHGMNGGKRREWPRLSVEQRGTIERLLERGGLSLRGIAAVVGCSVRTVWVTQQRLGHQRKPRYVSRQRCPGCGHVVNLLPCLICSARKANG